MTDAQTPVVLVGGGIASVSAARGLRAAGYRGPLALLCDEGEAPYDRPPLSKQYLAGTLDLDAVKLLGAGESVDLEVEVHHGRRAVGLDPGRRTVVLDDGTEMRYSAAVIATGARARRLPLHRDLERVHYLRSRADADQLRTSLQPGRRLVVVGAGFVGLEVAATARSAGLEVTVLEAAPAPLTRVLGEKGGMAVADLHRRHGVTLRFGASIVALTGEGHVTGVEVRQQDRVEHLPADVVVVGVGAVPCTDWLAGSGVAVEDGVVCDSGGRTTVPGVFAAGDVSRWVNELTGTHTRIEQWQAAIEHGSIVAANVAAELLVPDAQPQRWQSVPYFWSDQYEHKVQFCGTPGPLWEGRQTARGWVACCTDAEDGVLRGVLSIDGPVAMAHGRRHVAAGCPWPQAQAWLAGL